MYLLEMAIAQNLNLGSALLKSNENCYTEMSNLLLVNINVRQKMHVGIS